MKRNSLFLLISALFLLLLWHPPYSQSQETSTSAKNKKRLKTAGGVLPSKNDTLLLSYSNDPDSISALISNDSVSRIFKRWVYGSLAEAQNDNPGIFHPSLAERWEFDEKNLEYTAYLRKGVKWHPMILPNGTPLPKTEFTANDVKFTYDCIFNDYTQVDHLRSYYTNPNAKEKSEKYQMTVTVVDDYTVKFKWRVPYFLSFEWSFDPYIIPEHVYSVDEEGEPISFDYLSKEFADGFNTHWANSKMCGTGPLMFEEWKKDERFVLKRNPNYWGKPFYFKKVVWKNIENPNTRLQMVLQNKTDFNTIPDKDHYIQSKEHKNVKNGKVKLVTYDYPSYRYIGYNQKREFFKNRKVRWALSHAVPVDQIIEKIWYGLAARTTGPFLYSSKYYNKDLKPIEFDLNKSKTLLDEAGWKDTDGDGLRDKEIKGTKIKATFDLIIFSGAPSYRSLAEMIKENFRKIGVHVQITPTKWPLMLQKLRKKEFDACILGWSMGWKGDPFQLWHSSHAEDPDSSNSIGYKNSEADKLIEKLRITFDEEKQLEIYHEFHRVLYEDQPYTFLFSEKISAAQHSRLKNVVFNFIRPCYDIREWYSSSPR